MICKKVKCQHVKNITQNYLINIYDDKLHTTGNMTQNVRINMYLYILLTISHA